MTIDPHILGNPSFYKAVEEAFRGNIPGGEVVEASIQDAVRDIGDDEFDVLFSCIRFTHSGGPLVTMESMWAISQIRDSDDSIRVPTPFSGRFRDMVVSVSVNTLDDELEVGLSAEGLVIGDPKEHNIVYEPGETGVVILPDPTSFVVAAGVLMSFSFFAPLSTDGNLSVSASIRLRKESVV